MKTLNEQIKSAFENPQDTIISLLKHKTNAFLENYISEGYIEQEMAKDCLPFSKDWWTGVFQNKRFAIHIDETIKPMDLAFANELNKANYEIIFVIINDFEQKVSFVYDDKEYDLETLVEVLGLKENKKSYKVNEHINSNIFNWCYNNLDYKKLIYHSAIEMCFLSKYFKYSINLDIVWANKINGQVTFFIGEVKFKSKNRENAYFMNLGEKILYEEITKKTSIQVVAIALVCNREDRQATLNELMNNKTFPIFYMLLNENSFLNLVKKEGNLSEFDKLNGKVVQNTIQFPFSKFKRVMDFSEIGKEDEDFVKTLNKILTKYSYSLYGSKMVCQKHIAKFYALFQMMNDGFNIDFNDYLNEDLIKENILVINGHKVLFKFVESVRSWNVTLEEKEFKCAKQRGVEYILVYQNVCNGQDAIFELEEIKKTKDGQTFYLVNQNSTNNAIKVLGCIPFSIFEKYNHILKAGVPKTQKNYYAARGLNYDFDLKSKGITSNQDTYFLQILNCKKDGSDKEPNECQLEIYDKTKNLPFLSSYVFY